MRLVDKNPLTGEWITFQFNESTDQFTIGHYQDTDRIIEDNKTAVVEANHKAQSDNEWSHYAKVPNIVILKWKQDHGVDFFNRDHWPKVMQLINSPEYRYLKRTTYFHDR